MNNSNVYIVGLALCTLGNIASPEMARDLSGEVERYSKSFLILGKVGYNLGILLLISGITVKLTSGCLPQITPM